MTGDELRFWSKVERSTDGGACWPWTAAANYSGRGLFRFRGRNQVASRVAYILTVGEIPDGQCVCHSCDNPSCCNPAHLWLGTQAENMADKYRKGRGNHARGESAGNAKLSAAEVLDIIHSPCPTRELSERFGVTTALVRAIKRGEAWKHLADDCDNDNWHPLGAA
jgi:hypothetical protein